MRILILLFTTLHIAFAADVKPNILWITSEDNGPEWLGCYGNPQAHTPRLDQLASEGFLFRHAYSNAPVCAVARSTLFTGVHAPSQGTHHMRSRHPIPPRFLPYAAHLREFGYYCTNASKTDYNFKGNDRAWWDECTEQAHYRNRAEGQPFFAVFNITICHESSLFPAKRGKGPTRLKPAEVDVPPYLPDLPEVRADIAVYHDKITDLDTRVGRILDQLEAAGLADSTIVFYYADHGGPLPRGKRYLENTGVRVPLIVRVPEALRSLAPFEPGTVIEETVSFVDLAPTALSLVGLETSDTMQGRAFLGKYRKPPEDGVFLYADRFDEIYGMRRGWTDGRWKYIRRFTPHLPAAPYSFYQFSMPSWVAWRKAWREGKLSEAHRRIWEAPQEVEMLFDNEADPWEIHNLARDPQHASRLNAMRARLREKMLEVRDIGVVPEPMFDALRGGRPIADFVRDASFDYPAILDLALAATSGNAADLPTVEAAAQSDDSLTRYWGMTGLLIRGGGTTAIELPENAPPILRTLAAEIQMARGETDAATRDLIAQLEQARGLSALYLVNVIWQNDLAASVPDAWIESTLKNPSADPYVKRFATESKSGKP